MVLPEAWELVEDGHLTEADFAAFTFDHAVDLWAPDGPGPFAGTVVEDAVRAHRTGARPRSDAGRTDVRFPSPGG